MIREEYIKRAKAEICKPYEKQSHYDGIEPWIKEMTKEELEYCLAHASEWEKMGQKMMNEKAQH